MTFPNTFNSDKFRVTFSNIPKLPEDERVDMRIVDTNVRSVTVPDLTIDTINSDFMSDTFKHPMSRTNDNLAQVAVEFLLSEDMRNYLYFYTWFQMLRHGISDEDQVNKCVVKEMTIEMLDNQNNVTNKMVFSNCILSSVGSLNLIMGQSEKVGFPVLLTYQEMSLVKES